MGRLIKRTKVTIRTFHPKDTKRVLEIFQEGMDTLPGNAVQLHTNLLFSTVRGVLFTLLFTGVLAYVLDVLSHPLRALWVLVGLLGVVFLIREIVWRLSRSVMTQYISDCLADDLADISGHYLQSGPRSHFWVAEIDGEVIGCVALEPKKSHHQDQDQDQDHDADHKSHVETRVSELRRMSVTRKARGYGVATKMLDKLVAFASHPDAGYDVVYLGTSSWQPPAINLYESYGFVRKSQQRMYDITPPHKRTWVHVLLSIDVFSYELDLQNAKENAKNKEIAKNNDKNNNNNKKKKKQ